MSYSIVKRDKRGRRYHLWYCKKCGRRAYLDIKGGTFRWKDAIRQPKVCSGCGLLDYACTCPPVEKEKNKKRQTAT